MTDPFPKARAGMRIGLMFYGVTEPPIERPLSVETGTEHGRHAADGNGTAQPVDVPAQRAGTSQE